MPLGPSFAFKNALHTSAPVFQGPGQAYRRMAAGVAKQTQATLPVMQLVVNEHQLVCSHAGLRCQATLKGWVGGRATVGAFSEKMYYEVRLGTKELC